MSEETTGDVLAFPTAAPAEVADAAAVVPVTPEGETTAPPAPETEREATGHCVKCGAIVPLTKTERPNGERSPRVHRRGGGKVRRGRRVIDLGGAPCGPVVERYVYHVFFWGPQGPDRDVQESSLPVEFSPEVGASLLTMWEENIKQGFQVTSKGAVILGQESSLRVKIQDWKLLGMR